MATKLKVILIIIMCLLLIYVLNSIRRNKISTKNALLWVLSGIMIIICISFIEPLLIVANFIGIKTVSNMMFFLGFVFLFILCFKQSQQLSTLNKKINNLTQELGILKNKINKDKK